MRNDGFRLGVAALVVAACSPAPPSGATTADTATIDTARTDIAVSFVNRVWSVAESAQIATGETRVFLSDGTMLMTGPNSTPALGKWRVEGGALTITEEGQDYPVDVLELTADVFRIRIRGPGQPVDIRFAPAEQPAIPVNRPAE